MKNNKGFTLVELLVAMSIMGLLIIMAFPTMRAVQTNNTKKKYEAYGNTVVSAAKLYVDSYGDDLFDPDRTNQNTILYVDKLQEKDLVKDINISGSACIANSNIKIIKYNNDYTYCLHLKCTSGGTTVYEVDDVLNQKGVCAGFSATTVYYTYKGVTRGEIEVVTGDDHYKILSPDKLTNLSRDINNNHEVFEHWKIGSNTYNPNTIYPNKINSSITFEAVTRPWKYTINYHKPDNNYSGSMDPTNCNYGQDCYLRNIGFSRTGYHFVHWKKGSTTSTFANQANVKTSIGNNITKDGDQIDLTAIFDINKCTVTFDPNGGSFGSHNNNRTFTYNYNAYMGDNPVKDGMVNANGGYYNATKTGYHADAADAWTSGTKTFDERQSYLAQNVCDLSSGSNSVTLKVNWKVSSYKCNAGTYLKKSATSCSDCPAGKWCPGGTYNYNTSSDQGINNCPSGYGNSPVKSSANTQCYISVEANKYIGTAKSATKSNCASGYYRLAHNVNYGSTSQCYKKPTCTISAARGADSNGWYNHSVKLTLNISGSATTKGIATTANPTNGNTEYTQSGQTSGITIYGYVGNAGGSNTCSTSLKLDSEAPKKGTKYLKNRGKTFNGGFGHMFGYSFTDNLSGLSPNISGWTTFKYCYLTAYSSGCDFTPRLCHQTTPSVCDTSGSNDRNFSSTPSLSGELRSGCNAKCAKKIRADYHVCDVANNCIDFSENYQF